MAWKMRKAKYSAKVLAFRREATHDLRIPVVIKNQVEMVASLYQINTGLDESRTQSRWQIS